MSDGDHELMEPFGIDDGELEGLSPQMCFTLGVEWQMFAKQLESGRRFQQQIHTENMGRLTAMMERKGREARVLSRTDDWIHLDVWEMD